MIMDKLDNSIGNIIENKNDLKKQFTVTKNLDICGQPQTPLY